jgi:hypothetical protein
LSDHVQDALARERDQVALRLESLRAQADRLHALVDDLDRDVEETTRLLRHMDEVLGVAPQLSLGVDGELRGRELQRVAVELLRREQADAVGEPVHYRDWYQLVVGAGGRVAGRDPVASFLTQVSRAPGVESVRPRSGLYRLQPA